MGIRKRIKAFFGRHQKAILIGGGVAMALAKVGVGRCEDMTSTIQDWLPTIISFAMLGMVMGFMKKMVL